MKKIPNFITIAITFTCIYFISCSKDSSSSSTTPPTQTTCTSPSACIINTWYLEQNLANYNGSTVTIFVKGGNANLINDFASQYWVFGSNTWSEYASPGNLFDAGSWKILSDSTVETNSTYPDTFKITSITPDTLKLNVPYDHNYPSYPAIQTAIASGLDTAKLSGFLLTFATTQ